MSFTFSVSYQNVVKKVSCPRTASVNQLANTALEKFKVGPGKNGVLSSGGKKLDGLQPVRFTNLVNNAKLTLEVSNAAATVLTLKLQGTVDKEPASRNLEVSSSMSLAELVLLFLRETSRMHDWSGKRVQLGVYQSVVDNQSTDFKLTVIGSLVGGASNALVRVTIEAKSEQANREKLQEEQRALRLKQEEEKREARLKAQEEAQNAAPQEKKETASVSTGEPQDVPVHHEHIAQPIEQSQPAVVPPAEQEDVDMEENAPTPAEKVAPAPTPASQAWELPEEREDTLYVAQNTTQLYENPEDDYNLTTAQAEKYFSMIRSMQGNKKKKEARVPQKYTVRIRFPDRSLLDLHIDDSLVKFGQFLKKLDGYVHEKHINSYKLKSGLPPFKELKFDFNGNNTPLKEHEDFQLEKLLLIWEPSEKSAGVPYLKEGLSKKDVSQLPTVMLESNRGRLEEEQSLTTKSKPSLSSRSSAEGKPKAKGLPKWFRP